MKNCLLGQLEAAYLNQIRENFKKKVDIMQDQLRVWFPTIDNRVQSKKFEFPVTSKPKIN
jgi:hypothetical protein